MNRIVVGTCLILAAGLFSFTRFENKRKVSHNFFNNELNGTTYIIIDKSDYELQVYDEEGWYATYPVVFGSKSIDDKMMEGDRKTPEGTYKIISKRPHEKWDKMMLIDYPTKADYEKFNARKAKGLIPKSARIGNGIGIHGTWARDDMAVDYFQNWTNGCISLKREEIEELYEMIPIGTKVTIRR
ncbi:MAG: L,D-transpeptidase [Gemmatimonadaceae bacterium]|nr:L,D-transpeptidase [Chitinophagaceae bacterium]